MTKIQINKNKALHSLVKKFEYKLKILKNDWYELTKKETVSLENLENAKEEVIKKITFKDKETYIKIEVCIKEIVLSESISTYTNTKSSSILLEITGTLNKLTKKAISRAEELIAESLIKTTKGDFFLENRKEEIRKGISRFPTK